MRKIVGVVLLAFGAVAWSASIMLAQDDARHANRSMPAGSTLSMVIDKYCAACHNDVFRSASGLLLEKFDIARIGASPELWAKAYRQMQAGAMPPVGSPRPDRATNDAALVEIERMMGADTKPTAAKSQEVATRLASMLWNSAPDAELLRDATGNKLTEPAAIERQVRRMLADDRAQALISRFFVPWLQLDALAKADPDTKYFPDYDISLRDAFAKETELFLLSQLREDRDPIELWNASYSFLNEELARHYGVDDVTGPQFRRVALSKPERVGLLGQGSVHMVTSRHQHGVDAAYTSPATRAKWVRLHFLGAALPNGFPGAQPVKPELPITPQTRMLPAEPCGNCHRNFSLGYALENFDPIGRWRTGDQMGAVDASGVVDGTPTNGVVEMRTVLMQRPEAFRTTITEKLFVYASTGLVDVASGTPETLVRARQVLRGMPAPSWSSLIAAVARQRPSH
jgi:Protein of unknown function (DUF1592)/Protein of unknown function (DUF1588)